MVKERVMMPNNRDIVNELKRIADTLERLLKISEMSL